MQQLFVQQLLYNNFLYNNFFHVHDHSHFSFLCGSVKMSDTWNKLGSCNIEGKLAVQNQDNTITCDKPLVELLLLKKLEEIVPGRYIVRGTYWGKKTTIRFARHYPCEQQWKFSTKTSDLLAGSTSFDIHETEAKCSHTADSVIARPRPLKSMLLIISRAFAL